MTNTYECSLCGDPLREDSAEIYVDPYTDQVYCEKCRPYDGIQIIKEAEVLT